MSNRKAHRRESNFRRFEKFVQHRLRRPARSDRFEKQIDERHTRRSLRQWIQQWIGREISEVLP